MVAVIKKVNLISGVMSKNSVISKLEELPPEAKKQADDFVDYLYNLYVKSGSKPSSDKPISESPFVGMWKDRKDMADSTKWVRQQRKEQQLLDTRIH